MSSVSVSIITPTYKWSAYIRETILSVQKQQGCHYEHIIINDNSPDDVESIILSYQKDDPRIIYIKNSKNIWIAWSRNKWIEASMWKYLCFLDHDDIFLDPKKLTQQHKFLETNPEYDIVSSLVVTIDWQWNHLYTNHAREIDSDIRSHLLQSNQFLPCAMMIRKAAILQQWWFDSKYDKSDDYDLWMKIGRTWKMYCIQQYMTWYRIHNTNTSGTLRSSYHMKLLARKIFWKNRVYYPNFWKALIIRTMEFLIPPFIVWNLLRWIKK